MIKMLVFDFDGVIINEFEKHYELSTKQFPGLTEEQFKGFFDGNVHVERDKLKSVDTGFDLQGSFSNHKKTIIIKDKVKKIILKLSQSYILGIISSANEEGTLTCLKNSNLENVFSFVYGFESGKLKTDKFYKMFDKFKVKPDECLFITDTVGDVLEARKVGVESIVVDYGYHEKFKLKKVKPFDIISSLEVLEDVIEKYIK